MRSDRRRRAYLGDSVRGFRVRGCQDFTWSTLVIGIVIHRHLVAVFFRSHGNPEIFERHRHRFVLIPVLLYAAIVSSPWVLVSMSVLATFWDVYHSGLQTFGFARIYDAKRGNDPAAPGCVAPPPVPAPPGPPLQR